MNQRATDWTRDEITYTETPYKAVGPTNCHIGNKRVEWGVPHLNKRQIPSLKQSNTPGLSLAISL